MMNTNNAPTWPFGEAAVVVNPAKRKKVAVGMFLVVTVYLALYAFMVADDSPLMSWAKRVDAQERATKIEPTMRRLADQGSPDAALWLAKHYPATEHARLEALVERGSGEAPFLLALKKWGEDEAEGKRLLELAAARGYGPAVELSLAVEIREGEEN